MIRILRLAAAVSTMLACAGCGDADRPAATTLADLRARIGADAVIEMTPDQFPAFHENLGPEALQRANELSSWAAVFAAESAACDRVEIVGLSDRSTRESLEWFVDCQNGERFRPTEAQVEQVKRRWQSSSTKAGASTPAAQPRSAALENITDAEAIRMCEEATKAVVGGGARLAWSPYSWQVTRHRTEGRLSIEGEFTPTARGESGTLCLIDAANRSMIEMRVRTTASGWEVVRGR